MTTRHELIEFIKANPGCKNADVAEHFGLSAANASTRTGQLYKGGFVTRKGSAPNSRGNVVYSYYAHANVEGKTKAERLHIIQPSQAKTHDKPIVGISLDTLVGDFVTSFANTLAASIVAQLKPRLEEELKRALPAALPSAPVISAPVEQYIAKQRLPRVGVIGVAPPKRQHIDAEFAELFEIVYWWSEDGDNKLKSMATSCEIIFVMDYVAHRHTQIMQSRGANLRRINGDIRALIDEMAKHYLEKAA
jgi:DNA-binding MarR family transcriptional regulator